MATKRQRLQQISASLSWLREMTAVPPGEAVDFEVQQVELTRELVEFDPEDVDTACRELARESHWFPKLAQLLERVRECQRLRLVKGEQLVLEGPPTPVQLSDAANAGLGYLSTAERFALRDHHPDLAAYRALVAALGDWWLPCHRAHVAAMYERSKATHQPPALTSGELAEARGRVLAWLDERCPGWRAARAEAPAQLLATGGGPAPGLSSVYDHLGALTRNLFRPSPRPPRRATDDEVRDSARRLNTMVGGRQPSDLG